MIIDTDVFQRLKNIEQTGMQVLYPSATHDRFMHSLGVYHLSPKAFYHFRTNVMTEYPDIYQAVAGAYCLGEVKSRWLAEDVWQRWQMLFQLASLLHDCGHSPFSHSLEFIYDLIQSPMTLDGRLLRYCSEQFRKDFIKQSGERRKNHVGQPHERMSALLIVLEESQDSFGKSELVSGFRSRIHSLVCSYLNAHKIIIRFLMMIWSLWFA